MADMQNLVERLEKVVGRLEAVSHASDMHCGYGDSAPKGTVSSMQDTEGRHTAYNFSLFLEQTSFKASSRKFISCSSGCCEHKREGSDLCREACGLVILTQELPVCVKFPVLSLAECLLYKPYGKCYLNFPSPDWQVLHMYQLNLDQYC